MEGSGVEWRGGERRGGEGQLRSGAIYQWYSVGCQPFRHNHRLLGRVHCSRCDVM